MKTQILFPTIPRYHCIDWVMENIKLAEKPENCSVLSVVSGDDKYAEYVEKKFKETFSKVEIIRNPDTPIDHNQIRYSLENKTNNGETRKNEIEKMMKVFQTYKLIREYVDPTVGYYWFIEDDTLFPLNTYTRYISLMGGLNADVVSGLSYYWHQFSQQPTNFWEIEETNTMIGGKDNPNFSGNKMILKTVQPKEKGVSRLGATGFGNCLAKAKTVLDWNPQQLFDEGRNCTGADVEFFYNCMLKKYLAFGVWDIYLPHITKYENGDIAICGRIDKSLIPIINKFYEVK